MAMERRRIELLLPLLDTLNRTAFENLHKQVTSDQTRSAQNVSLFRQLVICVVRMHRYSTRILLSLPDPPSLFFRYFRVTDILKILVSVEYTKHVDAEFSA
jgi:hypothetical protein